MDFIALSPYNPCLGLQKVIVYDSTLRDGEQMPGVAFGLEQKVAIATLLDEARVHQIEAGFPAVSEGEFRTIKEITSLGLSADILALSRITKDDIDVAVDSGVDIVLLFVATSDIHLKYKLKKTKEEILARSVEALDYCKERGIKASMSSEDSTRTDIEFLLEFFREAEKAGAMRLGITDTVGCASPEAISHLVKRVAEEVRTPISIHLHNDFGFALANAIAAVKCGAKAVTTTVNGIGERAGNVPLEQFVASMKFLYDHDLGIDSTKLKSLSDMVAGFSKVPVSKNQPLVGDNAFSHESGIHVAAVLSCPMTYECIPPEAVGNQRHLRMGKHTGVTYIRKRLEDLKVDVTEEQLCQILLRVKRLGEKRGRVSDREFERIVDEVMKAK
jgi:methanogen homocitrate synthase